MVQGYIGSSKKYCGTVTLSSLKAGVRNKLLQLGMSMLQLHSSLSEKEWLRTYRRAKCVRGISLLYANVAVIYQSG